MASKQERIFSQKILKDLEMAYRTSPIEGDRLRWVMVFVISLAGKLLTLVYNSMLCYFTQNQQ